MTSAIVSFMETLVLEPKFSFDGTVIILADDAKTHSKAMYTRPRRTDFDLKKTGRWHTGEAISDFGHRNRNSPTTRDIRCENGNSVIISQTDFLQYPRRKPSVVLNSNHKMYHFDEMQLPSYPRRRQSSHEILHEEVETGEKSRL